LIPITGVQNVRAQVTANLDFSQTEQTAETFRPNQPPNQAAIRSLQTLETLNGTTTTGGVPGALSNQPPVPATAPIVTPANTAAAGTGTNNSASNTHKELTTNYEVDRTIQHTKAPMGSIKRLSIAVVVNNPGSTGKDGKVTSRPYTEAEKAQITALVKETVGFDAKRGDSLNLLNSAFNEQQEVITTTPIWKQPDTIAMVKDIFKYLLITGGIGFLLFGVIKPAFKTITTQSAAQEEAWAANPVRAGNASGLYAAQQNANSYEDNLQLAKQLAKEDPKIVATVVKQWVNKDE
jgi:flagellar M-ring protein FliF